MQSAWANHSHWVPRPKPGDSTARRLLIWRSGKERVKQFSNSHSWWYKKEINMSFWHFVSFLNLLNLFDTYLMQFDSSACVEYTESVDLWSTWMCLWLWCRWSFWRWLCFHGLRGFRRIHRLGIGRPGLPSRWLAGLPLAGLEMIGNDWKWLEDGLGQWISLALGPVSSNVNGSIESRLKWPSGLSSHFSSAIWVSDSGVTASAATCSGAASALSSGTSVPRLRNFKPRWNLGIEDANICKPSWMIRLAWGAYKTSMLSGKELVWIGPQWQGFSLP